MSKCKPAAVPTDAVELERAGAWVVPDDEVWRQLRRILAHARFFQAPRAAQILRYVVEETLAGRSAQLKQYTLAVRGLGLSAQFDPQESALVRIHMRHLRQLLAHYYADSGQLDPIRIDLVKGSYIPSFRWNEVPVAATLTVVDLSAGGAAPGLATIATRFGATAPTVAVVEFANRGLSGNWYYLAGALAEELMIGLAQSTSTAVMGPFNRSLAELDVAAIHEGGLRYGATFVLDGSAQLSDEVLKVGVRLLESASGLQVWGHSYEYAAQSKPLLAIEQAIATHVCQALGHEFGAINRRLMQQAAAKSLAELTPYELMLRALHFFDHFTAGALMDSIAAADYAIQQEPNFAVAWGGLGALLAFAYGWPMMARAPFPRRALDSVARALSLDPEDAWIQFTAGFVARLGGDPEGERILRRLRARPCSPVVTGLAAALDIQAGVEVDAALAQIAQVQTVTPHCPRYLHYAASLAHLARGDDTRALAELDALGSNGYFAAPVVAAALAASAGAHAEALRQVQRVVHLYPEFPTRGFALLARHHHPGYLEAIRQRLTPLALDWHW